MIIKTAAPQRKLVLRTIFSILLNMDNFVLSLLIGSLENKNRQDKSHYLRSLPERLRFRQLKFILQF